MLGSRLLVLLAFCFFFPPCMASTGELSIEEEIDQAKLFFNLVLLEGIENPQIMLSAGKQFSLAFRKTLGNEDRLRVIKVWKSRNSSESLKSDFRSSLKRELYVGQMRKKLKDLPNQERVKTLLQKMGDCTITAAEIEAAERASIKPKEEFNAPPEPPANEYRIFNKRNFFLFLTLSTAVFTIYQQSQILASLGEISIF